MNIETKQEEARYYQDLATIESPNFRAYLAKNYEFKNGLFPEKLTPIGYVFNNLINENYELWARNQNNKILGLEQEKKPQEEEWEKYYNKIIDVLKEYVDMKDEYYSLIAVWIIGTWFHKRFNSYPYTFINATKGSGKTRLLKLIANLSYNGKVVGSMTDAVLFRTASERTMIIDEFENVNEKGKESLKLLLNSAYKKGLAVERMVKKRGKEGEQQVVEAFEVFCPIAMANISGMENVLADRCIPIILEKSVIEKVIKRIENFENDVVIKQIKDDLKGLSDRFTEGFDELYTNWNEYLDNCDKNIYLDDENFKLFKYFKYLKLFKLINIKALTGRDFELFLPMYVLADKISEDCLKKMIELSEAMANLRKENDVNENKDIRFISFIANYKDKDWIKVKDLARQFSMDIEEDEKFNTSRSVGRMLVRLGLILQKRNYHGMEVRVNIEKAENSMKMYKIEEKEVKLENNL